jgi:hypothetical protein
VPLDQGAQLDLIEDADGYRYTALATDTPPGSTPGWTPATRPRPGRGPHLLRPRAVRMVVEVTPDRPSQWAAITRGRPETRDRHGGDAALAGLGNSGTHR